MRNRFCFIVMILIISLINMGCSSTRNHFVKEVNAVLTKSQNEGKNIVREDEINTFPEQIRQYLKYVNIVGKEKIVFSKLKQSGLFKTGIKDDWHPFNAEQYYYIPESSFYWYAKIFMNPIITVEARDKYQVGQGNMLVKIEPFFTIVDLKEHNAAVAGLVRYFSEIIWNPTAFIDDRIKWESIDNKTVKGTITDNGITTSALFYFNEKYEITKFVSEDKEALIEGKTVKAKWVCTLENYKEFQGIKIPVDVDVVFYLPDSKFEYCRVKVEDMVYNDLNMYK